MKKKTRVNLFLEPEVVGKAKAYIAISNSRGVEKLSLSILVENLLENYLLKKKLD